MTNYVADKTPRDLAGSGWYDMLPEPGSCQELQGKEQADWIIVGAGFAGLAAARRLTQLRPGERIVVIDAQRVGWGAAGRNSGFMIDLPHELNSEDYTGGREDDLKQIRLNRLGIQFAREAAEEYGLNNYFNPCGKYHGATDGTGLEALRRFEKHLQNLDEPCTSLDAASMQEVTGTDYYTGGIHTPGAVIIQPAAYVRGCADGLGKSVTLYENSPVLSIETGAVNTVHIAKGSVSAAKIILTVNGHVESFGFFKRRLMHVYTFASMTRQLTESEQVLLGGKPEWALIPAHPMGTTLRRIREGRIVVRNTFTYNPNKETSAKQIEQLGRCHDQSFSARFPKLNDVSMEYRWGGHLCLSLNSVPAFGELDKGIYSACCQNGLGTVKGTLSGKLIAELACGEDSPELQEMTGAEAPRKLLSEPFMSIGAKTHLWWMHKRAGLDL